MESRTERCGDSKNHKDEEGSERGVGKARNSRHMEPYNKPDWHVFIHWIDHKAMLNPHQQVPHLLVEKWKNFYGRHKRRKREVFSCIDESSHRRSSLICMVPFIKSVYFKLKQIKRI